MKFFYLSSVPNDLGNYEIHDKECVSLPDAINRDYLGPFNNGAEALRKAAQLNSQAVCCEDCCKSSFIAQFGQSKPNDN